MVKYKGIKSYESCYPDPIILREGDLVQYGEEDLQCPNWIFCKSVTTGKEGWVPKQILTAPDRESLAKMLENYSAHELTVKANDILYVQRELNSWLFCKSSNSEKGWIPSEVVTRICRSIGYYGTALSTSVSFLLKFV